MRRAIEQTDRLLQPGFRFAASSGEDDDLESVVILKCNGELVLLESSGDFAGWWCRETVAQAIAAAT
jgi:hypothetical protein